MWPLLSILHQRGRFARACDREQGNFSHDNMSPKIPKIDDTKRERMDNLKPQFSDFYVLMLLNKNSVNFTLTLGIVLHGHSQLPLYLQKPRF